MKKVIKVLISIFIGLSLLGGGLYLTIPLWFKPLVFYILNKNFGNVIYVEDIKYVFPNKIAISTLGVANLASFSNVNVLIQNPIKLSPIILELVKPKIIVIHNEKGEWTFPPIPGIDTSKDKGVSDINVEIRANIRDGIVVFRDLKLKKDIELSKVNGELFWKNQVVSYTVSTLIDGQSIKSYGNYDFSKEKGDLTFEFQKAFAEVWGPLFLPEIFTIEKGLFTGWFNTKGEKGNWKVKGEIEAYNAEGRISPFKSRFTNISLKLKIDGENINITEGKGNLNDSAIKFSGKLMPIPLLDINFKNFDLEALDKEFFEGNAKLKGKVEGEIIVSDSWEKPLVKGNLTAKNISIYDFEFKEIKITTDSNLPSISAEILGKMELGNIKGKVSFNLENNMGSFNIDGENINVEKIAEIFNLPKMEGKGSVSIKGLKDKEWKIYISGVIENGRLGDYSAERILFNFENEGKDLNFHELLKIKSFFFLKS